MLSCVATRSQTLGWEWGVWVGTDTMQFFVCATGPAVVCVCTILPLMHPGTVDTGRRVGLTSPYFSFFHLNSSEKRSCLLILLPFLFCKKPKKQNGESSFFSIEHPPPALKSEDHLKRQDLVDDNDSQNKSIKWCHFSAFMGNLLGINYWKIKIIHRIIIVLNPDKHDKAIPEMAATFRW